MESEQFFLKWNNFENNLASGFADLLEREAMVDVTLAAEGKIVQAHKIILSICSSYFKNMFQANPCQHPIVVLKDVGYQELTDMLDFMYKGEANVRQQDLPSFLKLAETLKVKGLAGNQGEVLADENPRKRNSLTQMLSQSKESVAPEKDEPCTELLEKEMFRKKRKRSISPFAYSESKVIPQSPNIKLELDECDNSFIRNDINNCGQTAVMKEERLSDISLDSYGENHIVHDNLGIEKHPGPSTVEENSEIIPQDLWNPRRTSKPLSVIWSFFNFDCLENKSECKLCGKVFKASPKTGTASVKYHLHFAHQILRNDGGTQ